MCSKRKIKPFGLLTVFSLAALAGCGGSSNAPTPLPSHAMAGGTDAGDATTSATLAANDAGDASSSPPFTSDAGDASRPTPIATGTGDANSSTSEALDSALSMDGSVGDAAPSTSCDPNALALANSTLRNGCGLCFCLGGQIICNDLACPPLDSGGSSTLDAGPTLAWANANLARVPASSISQGALEDAVVANNAFAIDLYARLASGQSTSNVLTSPISASMVLTMTYAGAQGPTANEMATALHFDEDAGTRIFDGQNALSQALASRGPAAFATALLDPATDPSASEYDLQVVNSVWGETTYSWASPFLDILAKSYGTGVYLQDFLDQPAQALQTINAWVADATDDKINDFLTPSLVTSSTRVALVNAIHLKLPWAIPFEMAQRGGTFTRGDGTTVSPTFMTGRASFPYADDGRAQVVELPLFSDEVAVLIALPHPDVDLATYEASLSAQSTVIAQPQASTFVALTLPEVTFTSPSLSLVPALMAMGMTQAFDPGAANFKGMCPDPPDGLNLSLSAVVQKATLSMLEDGVEATATTVVVGGDYASPPPAVPMLVNRPYLVTIVDVPTGAVLFLGHIEDPTDSGTP